MSDAVVNRQADRNVGEKVTEFLSDHLLLVCFVLVEVVSIAGGITLDRIGMPILAGIAGSVAVLVPLTLLSIFGFLQLLRVLAPYLKTAD